MPFIREPRRRQDLRDGVVLHEDGEILEPAADVSETDSEVTVVIEVPEIDKDDIHVSVADGRLNVRAEARKDGADTSLAYHGDELGYGDFQRTIPLPAEVDASRASATLESGILSVWMPKSSHPNEDDIAIR